jgi:hypothetical protein
MKEKNKTNPSINCFTYRLLYWIEVIFLMKFTALNEMNHSYVDQLGHWGKKVISICTHTMYLEQNSQGVNRDFTGSTGSPWM